MKRVLFFGLIFITISLAYISKKALNIDELVINSLAEQMTREQLEESLNFKENWSFLEYIIIPVLVLLRTSLVALCISIGLFFYDIENRIKFKQLLGVTLLGEFILVLVGFFKLGYFLFYKTNYTFQEVQQFSPLSLINVFNINKIKPWLVYPLQMINLFEIAYFFILVYGLQEILKNNYWKSFEITAVSYGTGLLIWIGLVMFLTLNLS